MSKQVIVVVHGVGIRAAGICADLLSAALCPQPDPSKNLDATPPQQLWHPHSSDDFYLHEQPEFAERGLKATFAAELRRFRQYGSGTPAPITGERVVVDFYWGDVAGIAGSAVGAVIGLFRIILGLSHAVRENAMSVFPGSSPRAVFLRRLARAAPLILHGPVFALNVVLLLGLAVSAAAAVLSGNPAAEVARHWPTVFLLLGAGFLLGGYLALRLAESYLLRLLYSWVIGLGCIAVAAALSHGLTSGATSDGPLCVWPVQGVCSNFAGVSAVVPHLVPVLLMFLALCWAAILLIAAVVGVAGWWLCPRNVTPIVAQTIALMALLWFLALSAIWLSVSHLPTLPPALAASIRAALTMTPLAIFSLLVLATLGLLTHLRKQSQLRRMREPAAYLPQRDTLAERHRLIVSRMILRALALFLLLVAVDYLPAQIDACLIGSKSWCQGISGLLATASAIAAALLVLAAGLLVGSARGSFVAGLGITLDVLIYLNDYSWDSCEADPTQACRDTRTWMERLLRIPPRAGTPKTYWLRHKIHARLQVLMRQLIQDERPDQVVLVSHSQGTIIALDVIEQSGTDWLAAMGKQGELKLITMGSPYTHIYNSYFRSAFPSIWRREKLRPTPEAIARLDLPATLQKYRSGLLSHWVNIFRLDDFVGTHVDTLRNFGHPDQGRGWPLERPVPVNGHTNYWTDSAVFPHLLAVLNEPPPPPPIA